MTIIDTAVNKINSSSCWIVMTVFFIILISVVYVYRLFFIDINSDSSESNKSKSEAFTINRDETNKVGEESLDNFYANIYENLFYSDLVDDYEVGIILNKTKPIKQTDVLVIGSKTGKHVDTLTSKGFNGYGMEKSKDMVSYSEKKYPDSKYVVGDGTNQLTFETEKFTLITLLDFSVYTISNRRMLFENCYKWLVPGGFLAIHLMNVGGFYDSQTYGARERRFSPGVMRLFNKQNIPNYLGNNDAVIDDIIYRSDMKMSVNDPEKIELREIFKNRKNGNKRQNVQNFYTPDQTIILSEIKDSGFNMLAQYDLIPYNKPFQYIYILYKPAN
jgi:SAM-dependent methyltransferase